MKRKTISIYVSRLFISLLFFVAFQSSAFCGQQSSPAGQNEEEVVDSLKPADFDLTFGFDMVGFIQKLVSDYGQYEFGARYNIKDRYFPTVEIGIGKADHNDDVTNVHYDTSAPYFKVGCDFNIANQKHADHKILLGARYAFTSYKVNISRLDLQDPVWETYSDFIVNGEKTNLHWFEAVFSLGTRIWGPLRLGWSVRYKHRITSKKISTGKVWYTPGYGTSGNSRITAMFNIGLQLSSDLWKKKRNSVAAKEE